MDNSILINNVQIFDGSSEQTDRGKCAGGKTAGLKPVSEVRSLRTEFPMLPFLTERENS